MNNVKIFADIVDEAALKQIHTLAGIPAFASSKIRIMPDVHAGMGCVIGFTADLGDKVIPNIVGVDIGCGMFTVQLIQKPIDFDLLDRAIRERVPSGMEVHAADTVADEESIRQELLETMRCKDSLRNIPRLVNSMGTLGGGNHFIEVDVDSCGNQYLVIHTGSRNLGKQVADIYQRKAIDLHSGDDKQEQNIEELIQQLKAEGRHSEIQECLKKFKPRRPDIPATLCWLEGDLRDDYLNDMRLCQEFAKRNRERIAAIILEAVGLDYVDRFHTVHNYIDHNTNIVRKGAIAARKGERLLIPLNMRDGSILGYGKGNDDWNQSAPHGAGRLMSRSEARKRLDMSQFKETMQGVFTTSVSEHTLDEAPMAYKPMDAILDKIGDTVDVEGVISPLYNFKAAEA